VSAALRSWSTEALGTTALVAVVDSGALPPAQKILMRELRAIDAACSRFRDDSELVGLNRAAGKPVGVSELLFEAVRRALRAAEMTNGLVDPTVGRTLRLAGYDATFAVVARRDGHSSVPRFTAVPGWRRIKLDPERHTVQAPRDVELDLGATAKAFAADRAAWAATGETGCGVLVSLGGDIAIAGPPPQGGWPVLLADDHTAALDGPGERIAISSGGLATSSTTVRRWQSAAGELHHIIDPRIGEPARSVWRTVTVAADSCLDANTASTAAIVLGSEATRWLEERSLPARLVSTDGTVVPVGGWSREAA
jgi:thiamine biosynthesis lipoprotein